MTIRKEITSSIAVILFGIVFLLYSERYPLDTWACPGPGAFPLVVGVMLLLLAFLQLGHALWKWKCSEKPETAPKRSGSVIAFFGENPGEKTVLGMVIVFILYIFGIQWIGFFVSTFFFVVIASRFSERKGWTGPVLLSLGIGVFCYLMFVVWQKLSFPNGLLF
jgi:Tripartite tricarboxylate transporter TctB family